MTIQTEYRWRCDYCHNVSPPFGNIDDIPNGWVTDEPRPMILPPGVMGAFAYSDPRHFCCDFHRINWEKQHETQP